MYQSGDPIATTDSHGNFSLVAPVTSGSNLIVREVRQNNWNRTQPAGAYPLGYYSVNPATGTFNGLLFGDNKTTAVTGTVYNDLNGDGARQSNEPGLSGWQVYVDIGNTGVYQLGDPVATTNASGNYSLNVPAGLSQLIVREVRQGSWRRTQPAGAYPLGYYSLNPASIQTSGLNFGDSLTGQITGMVFHDVNGNGKLDAGETGLSGWTIEVDF